MYQIVICDDNREFIKRIELCLERCKQAEEELHIGTYTDGDELMDAITDGKLADVYILDIKVPGRSGMDILKAIRQRSENPEIVLVTGFTQFAVEACGYQVFRYIPKEQFEKQAEQAFTQLFEKLRRKTDGRSYIIENNIRRSRLQQQEIVRIYKDRKYACFVLADGSELKERSALKDVLERLDNEAMVMVDRSNIINLRHLRSMDSEYARLDNGEQLPLNWENAAKLKRVCSAYWRSLL